MSDHNSSDQSESLLENMDQQQLEQEATKILLAAGYNSDGSLRLVNTDREQIKNRFFQRRFENAMPRHGFRGASKRA